MPYIYQAAFLCDDCGNEICKRITDEGNSPFDPADESSYDSDNYPKYVPDAGESDTPNHCDSGDTCLNAIEIRSGTFIGELIEGTLTSDGVEYVREEYREYKFDKHYHGNGVVSLWVEEFGIDVSDIDDEESEEENE